MSISPGNVPASRESSADGAGSTPRWIFIVFIVAFVLIGYLVYASYNGNEATTKLQSDLTQAQSKTQALATLLDQTNSRMADLKGQLDVTSQKLGLTQAELSKARSLAASIRDAQKESDSKLTAQIGQVNTDLTGAKTDISATKQDLEATKAKLTSTIGDLGVQSGLIARNAQELEILKHSGDRGIAEIHLSKSKTPTRVGPIQVRLTKTDPKKSKYSMMVIVDDKEIEKRDKTAMEPVQFYVKGVSRPYEIVIFDVAKDKINGYLSTPKDSGSAAAK
jgi:hypothetical protein